MSQQHLPQIPSELLPSDGRFGAGPSKVRPESVDMIVAHSKDILGTSHRQKPVKDLVGAVQRNLAELLGLPDDYRIVLGNGGATAFWDAATFSLVEQRALHLVYGEFGRKFADATLAAPFLEESVIIEAEVGSAPEPVASPLADLIAFPHNETSTGVMVDPRRPDNSQDSLMVIDGTSAAGGIDFDISQTDVYYLSAQKGLGADGGLWLASFSPAAIERVERITQNERWIPAFLSLKLAIDNSAESQSYNTPALATLLMIEAQLSWMLSIGGLAACAARSARSAEIIYRWAEQHPLAAPFVEDPLLRSPVVATIDFDHQVDAERLAALLRANGIVDVEPYRKLGRNQLRISLFPAIDPDDVEALTESIDWLLENGELIR